MTSTCLVGSWKQDLLTWRTSCGCSTSPVAPGRYRNQPSLLPTPWRDTPLIWWNWPTASRWCWSSLATRQSTATSTKFRSTTSVSASADSAAIDLFYFVDCLIAFYWFQSNTGSLQDVDIFQWLCSHWSLDFNTGLSWWMFFDTDTAFAGMLLYWKSPVVLLCSSIWT